MSLALCFFPFSKLIFAPQEKSVIMGFSDVDQLAINTIRVLAVGSQFVIWGKPPCKSSNLLSRSMPHPRLTPVTPVLPWAWPPRLMSSSTISCPSTPRTPRGPTGIDSFSRMPHLQYDLIKRGGRVADFFQSGTVTDACSSMLFFTFSATPFPLTT